MTKERDETEEQGASGAFGGLRVCFCALVAMLAVFQFSENTADPDLWGHIVFGREILRTGAIQKTEIYSWTAKGQPWINHEWIAEVALGAAHQLGGGSGVLLLKMLAGLLTFALCLRIGGENLNWPAKYVVWIFGALAVVEISYGFAARPQIFTALFLAVELLLLRRIHDGKFFWAIGLLVLFVLWINTHGGALAGFGLLGLAAASTTLQVFRQNTPRRTAGVLWLAFAVSGAGLCCNPWGIELLRWLIESVSWMRPEIAEWNATPLGWDHAAFFLMAGAAAFGWVFSRKPLFLWEVAAGVAFTFLGVRAVRNTPLCGIVLLALAPRHLADALDRFRGSFRRLETVFSHPIGKKVAAILSCVGTVSIGIGTLLLHKEHPLTMEVPRSQYPIGAVDFAVQKELKGRMLDFFDWGEMVIFELPGCPVSIDGRLDTCYSRDLIAAHWKFYNGEEFDQKVLNSEGAELALLPVDLAGTAKLAKLPGWKPVYIDGLAVILARDPGKFETLKTLALPVMGDVSATQGRAAFPGQGARW